MVASAVLAPPARSVVAGEFHASREMKRPGIFLTVPTSTGWWIQELIAPATEKKLRIRAAEIPCRYPRAAIRLRGAAVRSHLHCPRPPQGLQGKSFACAPRPRLSVRPATAQGRPKRCRDAGTPSPCRRDRWSRMTERALRQ